ncbi:hypothetical protein H0N96_00890, partial [Candidatus Micrarchaeota archaeon]|nr:hypothetical protein [Candidatus Micrarchaeota archaeon]
MGLNVIVLSNNSRRLKQCTNAFSQQLFEAKSLTVIDTPQTHAENKALLEPLEVERVFHASDADFQRVATAKMPFAQQIFSGKYGGARNAGLFFSAVEGANAVFFDDDTRPANDCVPRFEKLFAEGKLIVCGKYLKHAGGAVSILLELTRALEDFADKRLNAGQARERLRSALCGVPQETKSVIISAGFNGGCAGIAAGVAEKYCFFPTAYRIEDGVFSTFAPFFLKARNPMYNPEYEDEALAKLPVVFHEKTPGGLDSLHKSLIGEIEGNTVAIIMLGLLQEGKRASDLKKSKLSELVEQAAGECFEDSLLPYFFEKSKQYSFESVVNSFGDAELEKEFFNLSSVKKQECIPSVDNVLGESKAFFNAQENWAHAVEEGKR